MSHWKLVEAEVEVGAGAPTEEPTSDGRWQQHGHRGGRGRGGGRGNRRYGRQRPDIFVPDTPETRQYLVQMCVQQM